MSSSTLNGNVKGNGNGALYIFTTSQTPLAVRYPRPRKPVLTLPPLVHRTLHNSLDGESPSVAYFPESTVDNAEGGKVFIPHPDSLVKHDIPASPHHTTHTHTHSPTGEQTTNGTAPTATTTVSAHADRELETEPVANYLADSELTVKLHLVGSASVDTRVAWVAEALSVLEENKGLNGGGIDTLLLGFKGVDYRGSRTVASEMFGCGAEGLEAPNTESVEAAYEDEIVQVFDRVQDGLLGGETKIGTLYAPLGLLKRLVPQDGKKGGVKVNALDTPDCHHLPKEYTGYARENGVELWAGGGGEGSDPLPSADLHNLLSEFAPRLRSVTSTSKLETLVPLREDSLKFADVQRGVDVRWVLSYTLVSKTRNVVKDKGYIVAANFTP